MATVVPAHEPLKARLSLSSDGWSNAVYLNGVEMPDVTQVEVKAVVAEPLELIIHFVPDKVEIDADVAVLTVSNGLQRMTLVNPLQQKPEPAKG